jgi:hypothetical protein
MCNPGNDNSLIISLSIGAAWAGGGPLGIDHRVNEDDSGIWKRSNQTALITAMIGGELVGALWEGGETRLGKTFWQSIDASVIAGASTEVMKRVVRRERPSSTDDPNKWFGSNSDRSFPSGEVATVSAIITPFVLEYGHDHPSVYVLELLPVYDAIARVKVRVRWQTDVLARFAEPHRILRALAAEPSYPRRAAAWLHDWLAQAVVSCSFAL